MIAVWLGAALAADLAVHGQTVYPVSGPPIPDGVVVVHDGRITAVGPASSVVIPDGATELEGVVVTPGWIDGLSVAGLTGPLNKPFDQDHAQVGTSVEPGLRAVDAYSSWDELVGWLRVHGVTTIHTGPSPGAPVGGQTLITTTRAAPVAETRVVPGGMMVFALGEEPKDWPGGQTRMGSVSLVRQALSAAREYRDRRKLPLADRPPIDLGNEALVDVLERRTRAVFVAHRADDLLTALGLGQEFGLDVILAGATEAYLVREPILAAKVPVLVGPVMARQWASLGEARDGTFENAALLADAGIPIGLMTGFESYVPKVRVVTWEAAIAATNGLGSERALEAGTLGVARILGIAARKGSLEVGKDGDLVVYDGDPFEYVSHVCGVVVGGEVVSRECR